MTREELEAEIDGLAKELVFLLSPSQRALKRHIMKYIDEYVASVIGSDEPDGATTPDHGMSGFPRNQLRAEQRKRAGIK